MQSMLPLKTLPFVERGRNFCERFESVTILFSDIVSFTNMAAEMDPLEVVNMLNELYRMYDGLVDKHHVYKVETIGDAFMCAGGVRPTQHNTAPAALRAAARRRVHAGHVRGELPQHRTAPLRVHAKFIIRHF